MSTRKLEPINWDEIFSNLEKSYHEYGIKYYTLIFETVSRQNFESHKFLKNFISKVYSWLQQQKSLINLSEPWGNIAKFSNISSLYQLKMINKDFNQSIEIFILDRIKKLNHILNYFNRINLRPGKDYSQQFSVYLGSIGINYYDYQDYTKKHLSDESEIYSIAGILKYVLSNREKSDVLIMLIE